MKTVASAHHRSINSKAIVPLETAIAIQSEIEDFMHSVEYEISSLDVLTLAQQSKCSAYDCELVALAQSFQCLMITMDSKLQKAFPETVSLLTRAR